VRSGECHHVGGVEISGGERVEELAGSERRRWKVSCSVYAEAYTVLSSQWHCKFWTPRLNQSAKTTIKTMLNNTHYFFHQIAKTLSVIPLGHALSSNVEGNN